MLVTIHVENLIRLLSAITKNENSPPPKPLRTFAAQLIYPFSGAALRRSKVYARNQEPIDVSIFLKQATA